MKKHVNSKLSGSIFFKPELGKNVSKLGLFLRRTGLDEIPQLINVIKGDMSFIGPRPLSFDDLAVIKKNYPGLYKLRAQLNIKPGITGYWQVFGNRELGVGKPGI